MTLREDRECAVGVIGGEGSARTGVTRLVDHAVT